MSGNQRYQSPSVRGAGGPQGLAAPVGRTGSHPQVVDRRYLRISLRVARIAAVIAPLLPALLPSSSFADPWEVGLRTWTSEDGRTLSATYVVADEDSVTLRLENGREVEVAFSRLSDADASFARELREAAAERRAFPMADGPLPARSELPADLSVDGGPRVFRTAHFEFETDEPVSQAFIAEAARVYEGTLLAVNSLPHGPVFAPPEGERFRGRFLRDDAFDEIATQSFPSLPGQRVSGLYLGAERKLLVPYSSLGARTLGSRQTLRKTSDTSTLVHEIVHQVMDRWLPVLPTWFAEGFAEYFATVPYQNGRFDFANSERGLRERLRQHYGVEGRRIDGVRGASWWIPALEEGNRDFRDRLSSSEPSNGTSPGTAMAGVAASGAATPVPGSWGGTLPEYRDSLLLVYYLMHLHRPNEAGLPVSRYLRSIDASMSESESIFRELAEYESRRVAYNASVESFNEALRAFRDEVARYNELVEQHNDEIRRGVPEEKRTPVGPAPRGPDPPQELTMPDRLAGFGQCGAIDLAARVRARGDAALLEGIPPRDFDGLLRDAYSRLGYELSFQTAP